MKSFKLLKNSALEELSFLIGKPLAKPLFIGLQVSSICCLKCEHCDLWKSKCYEKIITLKQQKKILRKLRKWLRSFSLDLTGGEPLLYKDLIPLVEYANKLDISVHFNTNGVLIDKKMADRIIQSGLSSLAFSLDSAISSIHDKTRGVKGTYTKVINAIGFVKRAKRKAKSNMKITINSIIMGSNISELADLVKFVKKEELSGISFQPLEQNFGAKANLFWYKKNQLWPDYKQVRKSIKGIIELKKGGAPILNPTIQLERFKEYFRNPRIYSRKHKCRVGFNNFIIDMNGGIKLCFSMKKIGNILEEYPEEIWKSKKAENQRRAIENCKKSCRVLLCNKESFFDTFSGTI